MTDDRERELGGHLLSNQLLAPVSRRPERRADVNLEKIIFVFVQTKRGERMTNIGMG